MREECTKKLHKSKTMLILMKYVSSTANGDYHHLYLSYINTQEGKM